MLRIPPVAPAVVIRERGLQALEAHVGAAHDGLAHVVEAVDHVPVVVLGHGGDGLGRVVRSEHAVDLDDGEQAV